MNIYVGNLSWSMTDEDLTNLFTQYGTVTSGKILKDKMNGRSKGFGFVEMEDDEAAKTAIIRMRILLIDAIAPPPNSSGASISTFFFAMIPPILYFLI